MAWFVFDENSARGLRENSGIKKTDIKLQQGNPLAEALSLPESILLLPGTEAPFLLHIRNRNAD
ncbi:MAG TPA: hypothetical protein VFA71_14135 [Terriglobales bacterium]|nr:hypothetical protein [Terriglobales bacterium]